MKRSVKILFVSYQVIAVLPSIAPEMGLPKNFSESMKAVSFVKLEFFQMISLGCLSSVNYHSKLLVLTLLPMAICVAMLLLGLMFKQKRGLFFTLMLVATYAVLPSVSTAIFGAFPCDEMDTKESYLIADYSIDCGTAAYTTYAVYSGLFIVVYLVSIPLMYAALLFAKRERIKQPVEEREKDERLG